MPSSFDDAPSAKRYEWSEIVVGAELVQTYSVPQTLVDGFIHLFQDASLVHHDDLYARARGFHRKIVPGTVLNGFLSHFVGAVMPGAASLLLAVNVRYEYPTYADAVVELKARVVRKVDNEEVIVLSLSFEDLLRGATLARAVAHVGISREYAC